MSDFYFEQLQKNHAHTRSNRMSGTNSKNADGIERSECMDSSLSLSRCIPLRTSLRCWAVLVVSENLLYSPNEAIKVKLREELGHCWDFPDWNYTIYFFRYLYIAESWLLRGTRLTSILNVYHRALPMLTISILSTIFFPSLCKVEN